MKSHFSAATSPPAARTDRHASVWLTFGLLVFLGLSGMFSGIGLIFGIWGLQLIPREPLLIDWVCVGMSPLLVIYGVVGAALVVLPLPASVRRYLATRPDS